jgi:tripartite-type tricarboxylate transporter receptor subunit TctC
MRTIALGRLLLAAALAFSPAARAQDYPGKPIRPIKIIVPTAPGAVSDNLARIVADKLREKWDQPVIVENRAGAAGNIGAEAASRAAPDGYTLLSAVQPTLVVNKSLYTKLAYDPDAFVPISVKHARFGTSSSQSAMFSSSADWLPLPGESGHWSGVLRLPKISRSPSSSSKTSS